MPHRAAFPTHNIKIDRPQFLKSLGAIGVLLALGGLAGCERAAEPAAAPSAAPALVPQPAVAVQPMAERVGPFDKVQTVAGEVVIAQREDKDGTGYQTLTLNGKTIYDQNDYLVFIQSAYDLPDGNTALLIMTSEGGNACPGMFRFITLQKEGLQSTTDSFGTCSDLSKVSMKDAQISVTLPDLQGRGVETWTYVQGGLAKTKMIDPNVARNATVFSFKEDEPTKVRGTLASSDGTSKGIELRFAGNIQLDGGGYCSSIVSSLPIFSDAPLPSVRKESDFMVTIACPHAGPVITAIQLAK